jgi:LacI family transcriptional regulator
MVSTLADVARGAGVHPGTASKALNPTSRHLVSARTVRRVLEIAAELDYQPNSFARGLRTRRSYTVGFLVPDMTNPLFPPIIRGVEKILGAAGLSALIVNTDNELGKAMQLFTTLKNRRCDGFILATAFREDPVVEEIVLQGIPTVLVNRSTDKNLLPAFVGDERGEVFEAIAHLIRLGHRRIAHIAGPENLSTGYIRHQAFLAAIKAAGLNTNECPVIIASGFYESAGKVATNELMSSVSQIPTAIVAGNDQLALGVIDCLNAIGLNCPGEISVIGFNDIPMMDRIHPALTTFALPKHEMGLLAAATLQRWIEESIPPEATTVHLPCPIVVRNSTGPTAT